MNQYETEALSGILASFNYEIVDFASKANVYIINTCTVTGLADSKCRQMIRRAKKLNPDAVIVAMGCYSQVEPEEVAKMEEVDIILGTDSRKLLPEVLREYNSVPLSRAGRGKPFIMVNDIRSVHEFEELGIENYTCHTRAFLKIQDGCDNFCAYCIIPYARGSVRSKDPDKIIRDINNLVSKGFKEFVLTGINLSSYGKDLKNTGLLEIIGEVCSISGVKRLRLGSVEPGIITQDFIDLVKSQRKICPHFHISLQSGSDSVLQRMGRKYKTQEYYNKCLSLKEHVKDVSLTTDIIVGFPGETEEEFTETLKFCEKIHFSKIHIFKYSPRRGTPAAIMPGQIPMKIKEERSAHLIELSDKLGTDFAEKMIGKSVNVLIEKSDPINNTYEGYCENYLKVICETEARSDTSQNRTLMPTELKVGEIVSVFIEKNITECLCGKINL